jgi:undecaprenyl-diphosphatase
MELLTAALLGILEGLTEFLPVSSTGHLILAVDLLGFQGPPGHVFEIVIQFGAILAVIWLYFAKLWGVARGALAGRRQDWAFIRNILLAFLPAAIIGFFARDFIKDVLFNPLIVSIALILGGVAILLIEKYKPAPTIPITEAMGWRRALLIGLCQCLAMIPGVSRSGATIMGALLVGMERRAAAEFSFFLAIPTMLGAASYDLYKSRTLLSGDDFALIATGFAAAFIAALLVVRWAVGFISRHGFTPFAYYRIVLGSLMLWMFLA